MSFGMAYATKKRNKKMCNGGKMAKGGEVGVHEPYSASVGGGKGQSYAGDQTRWAQASKGSISGVYHNQAAKKEHDRVLGEMKSIPKPTSGMSGFAKGGFVEEEEEAGYEALPEEHEHENEAAMHEDADMIARIMHKRKEYSKGGMVANDVGVADADHDSAEFDDLVLRDDLEDNSSAGNEHGNAAEDHDQEDIISRILRSQRKKDRMPRPA
jgi:hypothetical protein